MAQTMAAAPTAPKAAPSLAHTTSRVKQPAASKPVPAVAAAASRPMGDSRVELVRLSEVTWRVCDSTAAPGARGYIVGYLERDEDEFELLWMHPRPGVVHRHPDFDEALRAISTRLDMLPR